MIAYISIKQANNVTNITFKAQITKITTGKYIVA